MILFVAFVVIVFLLVTVSDVACYVRARRSGHGFASFMLLVQAIATFVIMPSIIAITLLSRDNGHAVVMAQMILLTVWISVCLVKLLLYLFHFISRGSGRVMVCAWILAAVLASYLVWNVMDQRTDIRVRCISLMCDGLPNSFDGYRILLFSDLHLGTMLSPDNECVDVVDSINDSGCDLAVFAGDLVSIRHQEATPHLLELLSWIRARDGVVAVQGNHDVGYYIADTLSTFVCESADRVISKERSMGWTHLRDSTMYLRRGRDSIAVTGIGYSEMVDGYKHWSKTVESFDPSALLDSIPDSVFSVVVAHNPRFWPKIRRTKGGDLTLSGHVHACQFVLNLFGRRLSPASLIYDKWSGLYEDLGKKLYVTDGIGCVGFFLRVGARPEISILELHSPRKQVD